MRKKATGSIIAAILLSVYFTLSVSAAEPAVEGGKNPLEESFENPEISGEISDDFDMLTDSSSAELDAVVADALSKIEPGMSDREKAITLHDYLVLNCEYGYSFSGQHYYAYGALVEGMAVCEGYARAYELLCRKAGIPVCIVSSDDRNHDWNMVQLDGKWYHVDTTWDEDLYGKVKHSYMFLSESEMEKDHVRSKKDWKIRYNGSYVDYNANGNTMYDGAFWRSISGQLIYNEGYFYYPTGSGINKIPAGNIGGSGITTFLSAGNCISAEKINGRLYYHTSTQIYSIKFDGTKQKLEYTLTITDYGYIYGMHFENPKLKCALAEEPDYSSWAELTALTIDGKPRISAAYLYVGTGNSISLGLDFENVPAGASALVNGSVNYPGNKTTGDYSITISPVTKDLVNKNKVELRDSNGKHIDLANSSAVNGICYYSVIDYVNAIISDSSQPEKLVNLCKSIRDYATNANLYFNNKTTVSHGAISDSNLKPYAPVITKGSVGQYYVGSTLVLNGAMVNIRHYFSKNLTNMTVEGGYWNSSRSKDGVYCLQMSNPISPTDFGKMYECKIGDFKISYGVLSYIQKAKSEQADTNLTYLLEDMYRYSNAAKEYRP